MVIFKYIFLITSCKTKVENNKIKYETDNFSKRTTLENLKDAAPVLNDYINKRIQLAVKESNKTGCEEKKYNEIPKHLGKFLVKYLIGTSMTASIRTDTDIWAKESDKVEKDNLDFSKSIYNSLSLMDRTILPAVGLDPSIKIKVHNKNYIIGLDKIGHFFYEGHVLYKRFLKSKNILDILKYSISTENGKNGLRTTGVKSYGDLTANYYGFRFWNSIIAGSTPYIKCSKKKYKQTRKFYLQNYINAGFDEAINCSEFRSTSFFGDSMRTKILKNLGEKNLKCPIDKDLCISLVNLPLSQCYVSPICWKLAKKKPTSCGKNIFSSMHVSCSAYDNEEVNLSLNTTSGDKINYKILLTTVKNQKFKFIKKLIIRGKLTKWLGVEKTNQRAELNFDLSSRGTDKGLEYKEVLVSSQLPDITGKKLKLIVLRNPNKNISKNMANKTKDIQLYYQYFLKVTPASFRCCLSKNPKECIRDNARLLVSEPDTKIHVLK